MLGVQDPKLLQDEGKAGPTPPELPSFKVSTRKQGEMDRRIDKTSSTAKNSSVAVGVTVHRSPIPKRKLKSNSAQVNFNIPAIQNISEVHSAQTNLTFNRFNNSGKKIEASKNEPKVEIENKMFYDPFKLSDISQVIPNHVPTKHDISIRRNRYKDSLTRQIHEFFCDNIPVFPNTNETVKLKRLHIIDDFVDKIADLFIFNTGIDYYDKVAKEIDECLRVLPMWEPQSEHTKDEFKSCVSDALFTFIKTFNIKWHQLNKSNFDNYSNSCLQDIQGRKNEKMKKDIVVWVENNFKSSNKKGIICNKLINKIKAIRECGISKERAVKAEIVNTLEPYFHSSRDKGVYVNVLAADLTNLLFGPEVKYNFNAPYELKKQNVFNNYLLIGKTEDDALSQISDILFSYDDISLHANRSQVVQRICHVLKSSCQFSDSEALILANNLIKDVRGSVHEDNYTKNDKCIRSSSFLILTSDQDLSNFNPQYQSSPKPNGDIIFMEKVSAVIRTWLGKTEVSFETRPMYRETVVHDITNDVHTTAKELILLEIPDGLRAAEGVLSGIILKAIRKYNLFTVHMTDESPQVVDLRTRILALDADDVLDKNALFEQRDRMQANESFRFKYMEGEKQELHRPKSLGILKDDISVWMNDQPDDIYKPMDIPTRDLLIHELATNIQNRKKTDGGLKRELQRWLRAIVISEMQENIDELAENLRDRIKHHQGETLGEAQHESIDQSRELAEHVIEPDDDTQLNEFIDEYIRKNNTDDEVVNSVIKLMLKRGLYKLSPSMREELFNNESNDVFNDDEFRMELELAKVIHEWLKNVPFYYSLLKPRSEITEYVHTLAHNIANIEIEKAAHPNKMDYDLLLFTEIETYIAQKYDEIADVKDRSTLGYHVNQLCTQIFRLRKYDEIGNKLYKMIKERMDQYHTILARDYIKQVLWNRRIIYQLKCFNHANPTASYADKEKLLETIPLPRDDSVYKFRLEMKYNQVINDWLNGLPVEPVETAEEELIRKNKVQELLQKVIQTEEWKAKNPSDRRADDQLDNFLNDWISRLKLEKRANIDVHSMISQLRRELDNVKCSVKQAHESPEPEHDVTRQSGQSKSNTPKQDPGEQMVETIEDWCNNLPIKEANEEATNTKKKQVATNIFQLVGSLNDDTRVANDNQKLRNTLNDEIEIQLQNLSNNEGIKENKESLKAKLIDKIIEIKSLVRDMTAGDEYVQELEISIDAALPNTVHRSPKNDPSYDLYKKRMVMLWLLENYDNAVDYHSLKYKKMLSEELLSLSEEVEKRNNFPVDKDEMMNNLNSMFCSAPAPNEDAIIDEVEHIKLRCEIEIWSHELPLKDTFNFNKVLERDQILTILSKTLFQIERQGESDADEKMLIEINKWTEKLPLVSGENHNIPKYSQLLLCLLKASAESRKCQRRAEPNNLTVVEDTLTSLKSDDTFKSKENEDPIAGPSCSSSSGCGASLQQLKLVTDKIISDWCVQLPLQYGVSDEYDVVKHTKLVTLQGLIRFVNELHYRPNTLSNEELYAHHLNLELDRILTQLSYDQAYWEEQQRRNDRKLQLINALLTIRPLVQEATAKELYKKELKRTISSFHESKISENTQNSILNDFIQYESHKDFESQELYKLKIKEALNNELKDTDVDPLLAANRLICELSKVHDPLQSAKKRRYSAPNPLDANNLHSARALRHQSLPFPYSQNSLPRIVPLQNIDPHGQVIPGPPSSGRYSSPLSASLPAPNQRVNFDENVFHRSLPLGFPPQHEPRLPVFYQPSALNIRPFPIPPPLNFTNDSYIQSAHPINTAPENQQNHYVSEPSFRGNEQIIEHQPEQSARPQTLYRRLDQQNLSVRELARPAEEQRVDQQIPPEHLRTRLFAECPEEAQDVVDQGYCVTCNRDHACSDNVLYPYPYYMYR